MTGFVVRWRRLKWARHLIAHLWVADRLEFAVARLLDLMRCGALDPHRRLWLVEDKSGSGEIARLCGVHGSDKGDAGEGVRPFPWRPHTYADVYELLFRPRRLEARNVLECGIGTNDPTLPSNMSATGRPGASLRVWRDYFPVATVFGVDIDDKTLFDEERIRTALVDQRDPQSFRHFWDSVGTPFFDIIIDDGLHEFEANKAFFEAASTALAPEGIFIIEDCEPETVERFRDYFLDSPTWDARFFSLYRTDTQRVGDNALIAITHKPARALGSSDPVPE